MKLDEIKSALEYAQFKDFRIREAVMDSLKALEADLDDVAFEPSVNTKQVFDELNTVLSDIETSTSPYEPVIAEIDDDDDDDDELEIEGDENDDDKDDDDDVDLDDDDSDLDDDDELEFDEEELEEDKTQQA